MYTFLVAAGADGSSLLACAMCESEPARVLRYAAVWINRLAHMGQTSLEMYIQASEQVPANLVDVACPGLVPGRKEIHGARGHSCLDEAGRSMQTFVPRKVVLQSLSPSWLFRVLDRWRPQGKLFQVPASQCTPTFSLNQLLLRHQHMKHLQKKMGEHMMLRDTVPWTSSSQCFRPLMARTKLLDS